MKIKFWGTRGSLPVSLTAQQVRAKLLAALTGVTAKDIVDAASIARYVDNLDFSIAGTYGGNSSCVQLEHEGAHLILDAGSGLRPYGAEMAARYGASGQTYHLFMSHLHWDHIMGFPFFVPAYVAGNRIHIYSGHPHAQAVFHRQQEDPTFPVSFDSFGAEVIFHTVPAGQTLTVPDLPGMEIAILKQRHGGDSYGWRFDWSDAQGQAKRLVYSTDCEHKSEDKDARHQFTDFIRNADMLIFDAMYSLAEVVTVHEDWGHSNIITGVELSHMADVKKLCLFHHEPGNDDAHLAGVLNDARRYEQLRRGLIRAANDLEIIMAWDGLELAV